MKPMHLFISVVGVSLLLSTSLYADRDRHERRWDRGSHHSRMTYNTHPNNWVIPLVVGGVLGYAFSEPRRESVTYVQSAPVAYAPQPMYQEQWVYFGECDCQRKVLVRIR